MRIVVLAGGLSPERDVSLSSGALIANALLDNGHEVLLLDVYTGSNTPAGETPFRKQQDHERYHFAVPEQEPDLQRLKAESGNGDALIGPHVLEICQSADVVFVALHGGMGENGQLQATLDSFGVPYTGTGYVGCCLAMDKNLAKILMRAAGVPTAPWLMVRPGQNSIAALADTLRFPCVVKPGDCGSSVGVTIVDDAGGLPGALEAAAAYDEEVLIEDKVEGREFSVGLLDGQALPVIEIIPKKGFYDYKNKYQAGRTEEICPARITEPERAQMQQLALTVHKALHLGFYSRIDFIMDKDGTPWCLEANTLPGMTPTSLLPQEAKAAGISYPELCNKIVAAAVK